MRLQQNQYCPEKTIKTTITNEDGLYFLKKFDCNNTKL
jgi:hypothetical protein